MKLFSNLDPSIFLFICIDPQIQLGAVDSNHPPPKKKKKKKDKKGV